MKTFFLLLLLTNIVLAVLQWLFPYQQVFSREAPIIAAEQLQLLSEIEQSVAVTPTETEDAAPELLPAFSEPAEAKKLCYTLGPFKRESTAQEVMASFGQEGLSISSRSSLEKEYLGMMVYIDGHGDRDAARATAKALAERGVRDYMIVNEDDKDYALSLGVFGLKKNAERRKERIGKLGYTVKTEARYRDRTIYWLDYDQSENQALVRLVDRLKTELGISRISHPCG